MITSCRVWQPDQSELLWRFSHDHLKVMGIHRRLSYETVGYAPDYTTQGSLPLGRPPTFQANEPMWAKPFELKYFAIELANITKTY
jgi:hypothetical protein